MEFSREGQHTIKCIITEEEILELGFSMDDIMGNGEKTQAFMNQIFDLAEKEFQTKFDMGIKTVRADFLPDHTLALTFSEHPVANGMMEHLKDIVNGLINSIPADKWEEIKAAKEKKATELKEETESDGEAIVMLQFDTLDTVIRFAKQVVLEEVPFNCLYKYNNRFYMMMDFSFVSEEKVRRMSALADEYVSDIWEGREKLAFLEEHAEIVMREEAIEGLKQI